jgi:hypothetical protein
MIGSEGGGKCGDYAHDNTNGNWFIVGGKDRRSDECASAGAANESRWGRARRHEGRLISDQLAAG